LFDIVTGLYSDGKANNDIWLQGHAGGSVRTKRNGRDYNIDDVAISVGLAVQPEKLTGLSVSERRKLRGVGLLAGFCHACQKAT